MAASSAALSGTSLSTQMNTRIERALKAQGDTVLERHGITPSQAIRSLWEYLAGHDDIPEYMKAQRQVAAEEEYARCRRLAESGRDLAVRLAVEKGLLESGACPSGPETMPSHAEMQDAMYEEMLDAYHANCL